MALAHLIERKVELQHVHSLLAEDAELTPLRVRGDRGVHLRDREVPGPGDPRRL